jgi:IS4 transposase
VSDQRIELAETGEKFRRIVVEDVDGEAIEYLTTLSPVEYDPVDVVRIYTLRTLIEILFRELKQYTNIENFALLKMRYGSTIIASRRVS